MSRNGEQFSSKFSDNIVERFGLPVGIKVMCKGQVLALVYLETRDKN